MNAWTCAQYSTIRWAGGAALRPFEKADVVGAHPRVERHEVGALQHVDRVHLKDPVRSRVR